MEAPSRLSPKKNDYSDVWSAVKTDYLIRSTNSYIVYLDDDGDVDWQTTIEYDRNDAGDLIKHNAILSDEAVLECTPCQGLALQTTKHFKRLLGEALAYSFEHDYANARQMLGEAEAYIRARSEETSRRWYLSASALMAFLMIALGVLIWAFRVPLTAMLDPDGIWLCLSAVAGSAGALLSVIWRSGQLKFDCSAGQRLHYLEGASRIWAGALSGVLAFLAVKSELIFAPLARGENAVAVIMLTAFAAGAAERLATSIISKFKSTHLAAMGRKHERLNEQDRGE